MYYTILWATHFSVISIAWNQLWWQYGNQQTLQTGLFFLESLVKRLLAHREPNVEARSVLLLLLLLLLIHFSRVRLCATPQTAAHQAPLSLGFSRQEHWSGLHFLLQGMTGRRESEVTQSCPTPSDPMDCSPPGSSVHGIFRQEYWSGVPSHSAGKP